MNQATLLPPVREALAQFSHIFSADTPYTSSLGAAWAPVRLPTKDLGSYCRTGFFPSV
jgi:hypothetical protein